MGHRAGRGGRPLRGWVVCFYRPHNGGTEDGRQWYPFFPRHHYGGRTGRHISASGHLHCHCAVSSRTTESQARLDVALPFCASSDLWDWDQHLGFYLQVLRSDMAANKSLETTEFCAWVLSLRFSWLMLPSSVSQLYR